MTNVILCFLIIFFASFLVGFAVGKLFKYRNASGWVNVVVGNEVHTLPVKDKYDHEENDTCGCSPKTEPVARVDGSMGWLVIHNALDGRE